jgi:malate dehydrogenase
MQNVAIIGAGELGGATAHALARSNLVRSITLIDEARRVAAGKALDIAQAAPVEGFATRLSGATDVSMAAGASIVILADRIAGGEWQGEDGLALLKRLAQTAGEAVILCAGPSQRELVDRGVRELRISRTRLFGSAPESLAAAARALAALAVNGSPRDISLSVLGVPPARR